MLYCGYLPVAFILLLATSCTLSREFPPPCDRTYKCSTDGNVDDMIWAIDQKTQSCVVFRNSCISTGTNCSRIRNDQPVFKIVTKTECQEKCAPCAETEPYNPLCAQYNGDKKPFANHCELTFHICSSGKPYDYLYSGICETSE